MIQIQKKLVVDEQGRPQEVILSWAQFCEIAEALGLDLDDQAQADLRAARRDWDSGNSKEFVPLPKI